MHPPDDSPLHVIKIEFAQRLPCATLACSRGRLFCELRVCELRVCESASCESASCESASCESASCELRVCQLRVASFLYSDRDFSPKIANVTTEVLNCISSKKTNIESKLSRYTNENKQQTYTKEIYITNEIKT